MIFFDKEPENFHPKFEGGGCCIEYNEKILLLLRSRNKNEGNTWCLPGGKREPHETAREGMVREIFEETGISVLLDDLIFKIKAYVRYDTYDFIWSTYIVKLYELPDIHLKLDEHSEYQWVTPQATLAMPLIQDLDECIRQSYEISSASVSE